MDTSAFAHHFTTLYNADRRAFVHELYAEDCEVRIPYRDVHVSGRQAVWDLTKAGMEATPDRAVVRVERIIESGDTVVCEVVYRHDGNEYTACSVLDMRDGLIVRETVYR